MSHDTKNIIIIHACIFIFILYSLLYFRCFIVVILNTRYVFYVLCLVALHLFVGKSLRWANVIKFTCKPTLNKASCILYQYVMKTDSRLVKTLYISHAVLQSMLVSDEKLLPFYLHMFLCMFQWAQHPVSDRALSESEARTGGHLWPRPHYDRLQWCVHWSVCPQVHHHPEHLKTAHQRILEPTCYLMSSLNWTRNYQMSVSSSCLATSAEYHWSSCFNCHSRKYNIDPCFLPLSQIECWPSCFATFSNIILVLVSCYSQIWY